MLTEEIKRSETYKTFLGLSIGLIPLKKTREAEIVEEEIRLHETYERLVTTKSTGVDKSDESDGELANRPTGRRRPYGITFRYTSSVSKKKSLGRSQKLKGIQVMTEEEQLAADTKKAIKASKEALKLQQRIKDSSEGAGITPKVPDELTSKTLSEGDSIVPEVPDEGKGSSATKAYTEINWVLEGDSYQSDEKDMNVDDMTWLSTDEEEKAKGDGDEEYDERRIDIEETDDERTDSENGDQAMTDAEKNVAEKVEEEKGDEEEERADDDQAQEDQAKDDIVGTLVTIVSTLEKDVKELKQINHSAVTVEAIKSQVPPTVNEFLGSGLGDSLQKVLQRHTKELKKELKQQESKKCTLKIIKNKQEQASK
ncbi:hypothetical protein Tco_0222561 [Tanacetum coccineum]